MSDLWWIPFSAGIEDGLNPCALMTAAIVIGLYLWLQHNAKPGKFLNLFIVVLIICNLAFNLGFFVQVLGSPAVQKFSTVVCRILAIAIFALGAIFFYDWTLLLRGRNPQVLLGRRLFGKIGAAVPGPESAKYVTVAAALVVSIISTVWPPNYYISMIANNFLMPGRRLETILLLTLYTLTQLWLALLLAVVVLRVKLPLRLQKLVYAAVFFVAGGNAMYFFGVV